MAQGRWSCQPGVYAPAHGTPGAHLGQRGSLEELTGPARPVTKARPGVYAPAHGTPGIHFGQRGSLEELGSTSSRIAKCAAPATNAEGSLNEASLPTSSIAALYPTLYASAQSCHIAHAEVLLRVGCRRAIGRTRCTPEHPRTAALVHR